MKEIKQKIKELLDFINSKLPFKFTKTRTIIILLVLCIVLPITVGKIKEKKYENAIEEAYDQGFNDGYTEEIKPSDHAVITQESLLQCMAPVAELCTYEYSYANFDEYDKKASIFSLEIPFLNDKTLFAYSGTITAGIKKLSKVEIEVDNENKKIYIKLPKPEVLHNEIPEDGFKTYKIDDDLFVNVDLDEYVEFENALKKSEEDKLIQNEKFWTGLRANTENVLSGLFSTVVPSEYIIEYFWNN